MRELAGYRLRIKPLASARGQPGPCDLDLDLVVFVRMPRDWRIERNLVVVFGIGDGLSHEVVNIFLREGQGKSPALHGKHLERQVSRASLMSVGNPLEKILVQQVGECDVAVLGDGRACPRPAGRGGKSLL